MFLINHNAYDNGTFGNSDNGNGRYGGVFRYPDGRVVLRLSNREGAYAARTGGTYRKAQRKLRQWLKGYNV